LRLKASSAAAGFLHAGRTRIVHVVPSAVLMAPIQGPRPIPGTLKARTRDGWRQDKVYKQAVGSGIGTQLQKTAIETLWMWDVDQTYEFEPGRILELVRELKVASEKPPRTRPWHGLFSVDCLAFLFLLAVLLIAPVMISASYSRAVLSEPSGVVVTSSGRQPIGAAVALSSRNLTEVIDLPQLELRGIRDCALRSRGAMHHFRVASLLRSGGGDVRMAASDGARLLLARRAVGVEGEGSVISVTFFRPFHGEDHFNLTAGAADVVQPPTCRFEFLTQAALPHRAQAV